MAPAHTISVMKHRISVSESQSREKLFQSALRQDNFGEEFCECRPGDSNAVLKRRDTVLGTVISVLNPRAPRSLKLLELGGARDDLLMAEASFQLFAILTPPRAV